MTPEEARRLVAVEERVQRAPPPPPPPAPLWLLPRAERRVERAKRRRLGMLTWARRAHHAA